MSQPQLQPPATPEQEAAELAAAIAASNASAAAFEEFAETLAVIEAFDIQENDVEFERVKTESRHEYDELERALEMSLLDERSSESGARIYLDGFVKMLLDDFSDNMEAMTLVGAINGMTLAGAHPDSVIELLHVREVVDRLRTEKAIRDLAEGLIDVSTFLGVPGNLPIEVDAPAVRPKRRGLEDPE